MKRWLFIFLSAFTLSPAFAQQPIFTVKFSEPLAVYIFVQNLSVNYPDNPFRKAFYRSAYHQKRYMDQVAQFDSIDVSYTYQFEKYPFFSKMPGRVDRLIKKNLIECSSLEDFKLRSTG